MDSLKSFVNKIKTKNQEYKSKQNDKKAVSKGFTNAKSYEFYSNVAKSQGEESARSKLRKKELKRIKDEAEQEVMLGRTGRYSKVQKKVQSGFNSFQKGVNVYNEMMGELKSIGSGNDSFYPARNSNQAYASGYGAFAPKRKSTTRRKSKPKTKRKSKAKQNSFWSQYY